VHGLVTTIVVAVAAFIGTMIDNFVAFAAQLALTDPHRRERAMSAQIFAVLTLIVISAAVGSALGEIPLRWVGVLAAAPAALAVHAWRTRNRPSHQVRRGAVTTFLVTVALGGDNLAVWIPLLRADGLRRSLVSAGVFLALDLVLVVVARAVVSHPMVLSVSERSAKVATPILYVALAIVILWQCHVFSVIG
jgi:cadmium resistance protein CadD (predicted permease)